MLIIAILILLLAAVSTMERNYNYLSDYVKFNRIVFIIFILGGYLAYNTLNAEEIGKGIGIYGGVFKITILSQVFDIVLFITGAVVTILTCFVPYNFKNYDDFHSKKFILENKNKDVIQWGTNDSIFKLNFKDNYKIKLLNDYPYSGLINQPNVYIQWLTRIKNFTQWLPDIKINTPYLIEKKLNYTKLEVKEYSLLLLYTVLGGSLLISSSNLISLYLSLELQSFTLYILSTSQIRSFKGTSGGLKYFLLGGLSSGFILLGCSLLYAYTGILNLDHIFMLYSDNVSNSWIDPCLLILFAGLLFKISAAPFHHWAPDVYSDVPTYSTTWLIIIAKLSILILMLFLVHNIHTALNLNKLSVLDQYNSYITDDFSHNFVLQEYSKFKDINPGYLNKKSLFLFWNPSYSSLGLWTNVLTLSAAFSLIIGTVLGLSQSRIKRLFAYSTIAHIGFLLLALSLNSVASLDAFIFYLIQYTITNLNLFFILVAWGYLYSRYYLEKDFIPVRYLEINPYSWKDIYIEPTLYDLFDSVKDEYHEWDIHHSIYHSEKNVKMNTIHNYFLVHHDLHYYDFKIEDSEWLYTPVPYLTNFKGMHFRDPFLAFCLSVTIFSLAGIPPFIGFFAKQQVLLASMQLDYYFISIIAILTSVIGAAYYLRIIKFIYFYDDVFTPYYMSNEYISNNYNLSDFGSKPEFTLNSISHINPLPILPSNNLSLIIALLTNISLFYILKPYILINGIYLLTNIFFFKV